MHDLLGAALPPRSAPEPAADRGAVPSGLAPLDEAAGGWRAGEVALVGGPSGVGKSALAYGAALHAALDRGIATALVPLKHSVDTCVGRLVCARAGVPFARWRGAAASQDERVRLEAAARELEAAPLFIHPAADVSSSALADDVRRLARLHGLRFLVLDGLTALAAGDTLATLSALAAEQELAVLATFHTAVLPAAPALAPRVFALDESATLTLLPDGTPVPLRFDRETLRFQG